MRSRIIQDPDPERAGTDDNDQGSRESQPTGIAGRLARWSATHRKLAIWGWLGLVVVLFMLIPNAKLVETQRLTTAEQVSGAAGEAERILDDAGLRPTEELMMLQNPDLSA